MYFHQKASRILEVRHLISNISWLRQSFWPRNLPEIEFLIENYKSHTKIYDVAVILILFWKDFLENSTVYVTTCKPLNRIMPLALGKVPLVPLFWFFLFQRSRIHLNHIFFNLDGLGPTSKMPTLIYWSIMMQQSTKIKSKIIQWSIWKKRTPKWTNAVHEITMPFRNYAMSFEFIRLVRLYLGFRTYSFWSEVIYAHFTASVIDDFWQQKLMILLKMTRY